MTHRLKCGKYVCKCHVFGGNYAASPCFCVSVLSKVITGALNFELLKNICCAVYTIKHICDIKIARVDETLCLKLCQYNPSDSSVRTLHRPVFPFSLLPPFSGPGKLTGREDDFARLV